jgi:hypothetical protein
MAASWSTSMIFWSAKLRLARGLTWNSQQKAPFTVWLGET